MFGLGKKQKNLDIPKIEGVRIIECPQCRKLAVLHSLRTACEYCGKIIGNEGLNITSSGERFYFCRTCNTTFESDRDYKEHHFKHGHA